MLARGRKWPESRERQAKHRLQQRVMGTQRVPPSFKYICVKSQELSKVDLYNSETFLACALFCATSILCLGIGWKGEWQS